MHLGWAHLFMSCLLLYHIHGVGQMQWRWSCILWTLRSNRHRIVYIWCTSAEQLVSLLAPEKHWRAVVHLLSPTGKGEHLDRSFSASWFKYGLNSWWSTQSRYKLWTRSDASDFWPIIHFTRFTCCNGKQRSWSNYAGRASRARIFLQTLFLCVVYS